MHRTTILASLAGVLLTAGAAMAQEGPNDTVSGAAYFGKQVPLIQTSGVTRGTVQSGTPDIDIPPANSQWQSGYDNVNNEGSNG
jgi:hypothetical protein